ncbi:MAG: type I phosphomannose isomerase catalytic subunit [Caldilineales bacterium]
MAHLLYPLTFTPVLKSYLWGGRNLQHKLGRTLPDALIVAESWEIAAHEDGAALVNNGPYAGQTLSALTATLGLDLIGRHSAWAQARGKFPLLVKLLDAHTALSVQVHPDDAYAQAHEGNELGKTEMWVVLHAEPNAEIILGLRAGVGAAQLCHSVADNTLHQHLHRVRVQAGDHICVPAGTLHAIMGGLLIAEIQQNSNATYRVYDWGRTDAAGTPRALHLEKALAVLDFSRSEPGLCAAQPLPAAAGAPAATRELLCHNRYFTTERITLPAGEQWQGECNGDTLEIWGVLSGEVNVNRQTLAAVQFCLLPAALGLYTITATSAATLLRTYVA